MNKSPHLHRHPSQLLFGLPPQALACLTSPLSRFLQKRRIRQYEDEE